MCPVPGGHGHVSSAMKCSWAPLSTLILELFSWACVFVNELCIVDWLLFLGLWWGWEQCFQNLFTVVTHVENNVCRAQGNQVCQLGPVWEIRICSSYCTRVSWIQGIGKTNNRRDKLWYSQTIFIEILLHKNIDASHKYIMFRERRRQNSNSIWFHLYAVQTLY